MCDILVPALVIIGGVTLLCGTQCSDPCPPCYATPQPTCYMQTCTRPCGTFSYQPSYVYGGQYYSSNSYWGGGYGGYACGSAGWCRGQ